MTSTQQFTPYEIRLKNWELKKDKDNPNYLHVKAWAEKNGYYLSQDVSYNGFIYVKKHICETSNPHDGYELELQIYDGLNDRKYHSFQQFNMEAEFGNIMSPTTYRYKMAHGQDTNKSSQNLDELLDFTLKLEATLTAEHNEHVKKRTERETSWVKNPELKEQYFEEIRNSIKKK